MGTYKCMRRSGNGKLEVISLFIVRRKADRSSFRLGFFISRYKSHVYVQVQILLTVFLPMYSTKWS